MSKDIQLNVNDRTYPLQLNGLEVPLICVGTANERQTAPSRVRVKQQPNIAREEKRV